MYLYWAGEKKKEQGRAENKYISPKAQGDKLIRTVLVLVKSKINPSSQNFAVHKIIISILAIPIRRRF